MNNFDVFNGDADGVLSLVQLRLHSPVESILVTGVKRDVALLNRVPIEKATSVVVLDISMEKNIVALQKLLDANINVTYCDHHRSGPVPSSASLNAHIDLDANTCTALIVDELLAGKYHHWAIAAAYGDNLLAKADELAKAASLSAEQSAFLKELGTLVNYNGYGSAIEDLHFHPADLYRELVKFESPFDLLSDPGSIYFALKSAYADDMANIESLSPIEDSEHVGAYHLPNEAWSKRVSGVFGNDLANKTPSRAHVVFTDNPDGESLTVSLRAPLDNKQGAGDICAQFPSGGGRAAAAGVNLLPKSMKRKFLASVEQYYK